VGWRSEVVGGQIAKLGAFCRAVRKQAEHAESSVLDRVSDKKSEFPCVQLKKLTIWNVTGWVVKIMGELDIFYG
jgi:hypothetical protein